MSPATLVARWTAGDGTLVEGPEAPLAEHLRPEAVADALAAARTYYLETADGVRQFTTSTSSVEDTQYGEAYRVEGERLIRYDVVDRWSADDYDWSRSVVLDGLVRAGEVDVSRIRAEVDEREAAVRRAHQEERARVDAMLARLSKLLPDRAPAEIGLRFQGPQIVVFAQGLLWSDGGEYGYRGKDLAAEVNGVLRERYGGAAPRVSPQLHSESDRMRFHGE